jgi:hypothetical protein
MINKENISAPIIIIIIGLISLVLFHAWFSSFVGEDEWKGPTPIPDSLNDIYVWPSGVNYLGTPIPEGLEIDPFRKNIIEDYKKFMQKRREVYADWKIKKAER